MFYGHIYEYHTYLAENNKNKSKYSGNNNEEMNKRDQSV